MFLRMSYTVLVREVPLSVQGARRSINPAINQCRVRCNYAGAALRGHLCLRDEAEIGCCAFIAKMGNGRPPDEQTWKNKTTK